MMSIASPPPAGVSTRERPHLSRDDLRDVLTIALRAGQLMLENGANTARVEETVHRIGTALGAEWLDVFVIPGGIIATDVSQDEHRTKIQRVVKSGIDLNRVAAVLALSRRAESGELGRDAVRAELERIAVQPTVYSHSMTTFAVAGGCACFAALFGGGPREIVATLLAAGSAQLLRDWLGRINLSRLLTTWITAAVAAGLALTLTTLLGAPAPALALLSSVLLLVPGVLMVSSVADLFRGDTLPGLGRGVLAFLTISAIGVGIWTVLLLGGAQMAMTPAAPPALPLALALALMATAGFAILFDVPRRALFACAAVGMLAYLARQGALAFGVPMEAAIFIGGVVVGLLSELLARVLRLPTAIFTIPGFIPLVPGVAAFRTVLDLVNADYAAGTADFVRTALLTGALATGFGTINALARARRKPLF
jgi:uncharacterized membrane protein YjjP (DUF1212 family)